MNTMELLMLMQPIANSIGTLAVWFFVIGCILHIAFYTLIILSKQSEGLPPFDEYEKFYARTSTRHHQKIWDTWVETIGLRRAFKLNTIICIVSLALYLLSLAPSHAKEMFKNTVVYRAVTSDTTEHAVKTLDKLLDTIDAKLDKGLDEK